jgi:hypothetical protein
MNWTEDKDAMMLYKIACELHNINKEILSPIDNSKDSYYIDRKSCLNKELEELDFDTPVKLKKYLKSLWDKDEVMKKFIPVVLAATFKRYPQMDKEGKKETKGKDQELPDFVYNF